MDRKCVYCARHQTPNCALGVMARTAQHVRRTIVPSVCKRVFHCMYFVLHGCSVINTMFVKAQW